MKNCCDSEKSEKKHWLIKIFRPAVSFIMVVALVLCTVPLFAQSRPIQIRLASLAPENTPWGAALN